MESRGQELVCPYDSTMGIFHNPSIKNFLAIMKDPAFPFYAQDFLTGVMHMTMEERGIYITLLSYQWAHGSIPTKRVGLILGLPWESVSDEVKAKFKLDGEILKNPRLEEERNKRAEFKEKQRKNGRKGGRPKNPKETQTITQTITQKKPLEDENEKEDENDREKEYEKISGKIDLMGFVGQARHWMESEHGYIWDDSSQQAVTSMEFKLIELLKHEKKRTGKEELLARFKKIISNLPVWVRKNKFSLEYINSKFNEVKNGAAGHKSNSKSNESPIARKTEFKDFGGPL